MAATQQSATWRRGYLISSSEVAALNQILEGDDVPFRTRLVAHGSYVRGWADTLEESVNELPNSPAEIPIGCNSVSTSNYLVTGRSSAN